MHELTDELLVESYYKAINLELNPHFIQLLESEIIKRSLNINVYKKNEGYNKMTS